MTFWTLLSSIWGPFCAPKLSSEVLRQENADLAKPLFSLRKTILLELGGHPGTTKTDLRNGFEIQHIFLRFRPAKRTEKRTILTPKSNKNCAMSSHFALSCLVLSCLVLSCLVLLVLIAKIAGRYFASRRSGGRFLEEGSLKEQQLVR